MPIVTCDFSTSQALLREVSETIIHFDGKNPEGAGRNGLLLLCVLPVEGFGSVLLNHFFLRCLSQSGESPSLGSVLGTRLAAWTSLKSKAISVAARSIRLEPRAQLWTDSFGELIVRSLLLRIGPSRRVGQDLGGPH